MKILFITHDDFPKSGAIGNIINKYIHEGGLIKEFEEVHVVTLDRNIFNGVKDERIDGVWIHRVKTSIFYSVKEINKHFRTHPILCVNLLLCKVLRRFSAKYNSNLFLDQEIVKSLVKKMNDVDAKTFDYIVATACDYYNIESAIRFIDSLKGNKKPKLVTYQFDPCSTNQTFNIEKKELVSFEDRFFEKSDLILCTPIIYNEYKKCGREMSKVEDIEFPLICKNYNSIKYNDDGITKIKCVFSGRIYAGIRDPRYTMRLLEKFTDKIKFILVGVEDNQIPGKYKGLFYTLGEVEYNEAYNIINDSDILVNIGNSMKNQVPSKIFEYISTGKPIINICKHRDCPTLRYMEKYPLALNLFEEDDIFEDQVNILDQFLRDNYNRRIPSDDIYKLYKECTVEYCAKKFMDLLEDIKFN